MYRFILLITTIEGQSDYGAYLTDEDANDAGEYYKGIIPGMTGYRVAKSPY